MKSSACLPAVAVVMVACGDPMGSFEDVERLCETNEEPCPVPAPVRLELADLDGDGAAEVVTAGLTDRLWASSASGELIADIHVPVGWGSEISSCSLAGEASELLVRHGEWWSRWGLSLDRLELVDGGFTSAGAVIRCADLGRGQLEILELDGTTLTSTGGSVELELHAAVTAFEATPRGVSDGVIALFMIAENSGDVEVALVDLNGPSLVQQAKWSSGLGRIRALQIVGGDLAVVGDVDIEHAELVLVRDVDPAAVVSWQSHRDLLPWSPVLLRAAELDGDGDSELIMASRPASEVAVHGLGETELMIVELGFEGVDVASGDRDGDGLDEVYILDGRDERIVELGW